MGHLLRYTLVILIFLFFSCKKLIDVKLPANQLTKEVVFTNDRSANAAISGLYSRMMQSNLQFMSGALTILPAMSADEIINSFPGNYNEFSRNSLTATNSIIQNNLWATAYNYIYQTNSIIEGLNATSGVSIGVKNQLIGEAKFIRAFINFYLANLFGDIPIITKTDFRENLMIGRMPESEVYKQIIIDLVEAQILLPESYFSQGKTRPNKWAATALLSRVYLYLKEFSKSESEATKVINTGKYNLVQNLNTVFLANSNEAIWQLMPVQNNLNTWEGNIFISNPGIVPQFVIDSGLFNAFDVNDLRLSWINKTTVGTKTYHYPFKYKIKNNSVVTEHNTILRLGELYLIRAEARAHQENLQGALLDLNTIRNRAGLEDVIEDSKEEILKAIINERRLELFAEWGHRWFDLKRVGKLDAIMSLVKRSVWKPTSSLYPIPFLEIQRNVNLTQNPGY